MVVALEQGDIPQQKPHADVVHGAPGQHLLGQCHGGFAITPVHQAQQGAMRQAEEGAVVHFTPGDLADVTLGDVRLRLAKGLFIHLGGFILQTQRPQPVGDEVLDFQVVRGGGFQLARLHQSLLVGDPAGFELLDQHVQGFFVLPVATETAVLGGLAGFGVIEGFDGEGDRGLGVIGLRLFAGHGRVRWVQGQRCPCLLGRWAGQ